jgi:hypothetical protein
MFNDQVWQVLITRNFQQFDKLVFLRRLEHLLISASFSLNVFDTEAVSPHE